MEKKIWLTYFRSKTNPGNTLNSINYWLPIREAPQNFLSGGSIIFAKGKKETGSKIYFFFFVDININASCHKTISRNLSPKEGFNLALDRSNKIRPRLEFLFLYFWERIKI